jgi:hypothetical protein
MKANIFQIFYDERTRNQIDPGFIAMDNLDNPRADWREYWAIRKFFLSSALEENELYGFLSPSFHTKTNLNAAQVHSFIAANPGREVYTFSPFIQDETCYLNMFEHGNVYHPGTIEVAQTYLKEIQLEVNLEDLVMDFRSMVFCNYIVAKPSFWNTWFALNEKLFDIAEHDDSDLSRELNSLTNYRLPVAMKVFLVERMASLVLAMCPDITTAYYDPMVMPWSDPGYRPYVEQMKLLNQIKSDYLRTGDTRLLGGFYALRGAILTTRVGSSMEKTKEGFMRTPAKKASELLYVCLSDRNSSFALPKNISPVMIGPAQRPGAINARDMSPEWDERHAELGTLGGCFAIKNYIVKTGLKVRLVGICTGDAFVSNRPVATGSQRLAGAADLLRGADLTGAMIADATGPGTRDFLIGGFRTLDGHTEGHSMFDAVKKTDEVEDMLRFTAMAVELGALSKDDVMPFFNERRFSEGGLSMGVFESDFWIRSISAIENIVSACLKRYPSAARGARLRVWAHCAERLGSFMLLRQLETHYTGADWPNTLVGRLNHVEPATQMFTISLTR